MDKYSYITFNDNRNERKENIGPTELKNKALI